MNDLFVCKHCGGEYGFAEMRKDSRNSSGVRNQCLYCKRKQDSAREAKAVDALATATDSRLCRICGESKPLSAMVKDKRKPDGTDGRCLDCRRQNLTVKSNAFVAKIADRDRSHICEECGTDTPYAEMTKDRKRFGGVGPICLACRRAKDRARAAELRAEQQRLLERQRQESDRLRAEERQVSLLAGEWEFCYRCNGRFRPGSGSQLPSAIVAPPGVRACKKCFDTLQQGTSLIEAERKRIGLDLQASADKVKAAARVEAVKALIEAHRDEYDRAVTVAYRRLGVQEEKKWVRL